MVHFINNSIIIEVELQWDFD